jgi:diguanylate cyclase (GGDEF)-like protein
MEGDEIYFAAVSTQVGSAWHTGQKIPMPGTATEWVCLNKRPFYEHDLTQRKRFWTGEEYLKRGIRSVLYLPLVNKGEAIGVLIIGSKRVAAYSPEQTILLEHLASQISAPIENSRLYTKAEEIARIDGVTGLFNRRHFDERMREEIDRHSRYGDVLSLLLIDLDNFKKYNDTFGHLAGDRMLIHAAGLVKAATRSSDLAFRYGGDEFAVLAVEAYQDSGDILVARLQENLRTHNAQRNSRYQLSISVGLDYYDPTCPCSIDELLDRADRAMYEQKQQKKQFRSSERGMRK